MPRGYHGHPKTHSNSARGVDTKSSLSLTKLKDSIVLKRVANPSLKNMMEYVYGNKTWYRDYLISLNSKEYLTTSTPTKKYQFIETIFMNLLRASNIKETESRQDYETVMTYLYEFQKTILPYIYQDKFKKNILYSYLLYYYPFYRNFINAMDKGIGVLYKEFDGYKLNIALLFYMANNGKPSFDDKSLEYLLKSYGLEKHYEFWIELYNALDYIFNPDDGYPQMSTASLIMTTTTPDVEVKTGVNIKGLFNQDYFSMYHLYKTLSLYRKPANKWSKEEKLYYLLSYLFSAYPLYIEDLYDTYKIATDDNQIKRVKYYKKKPYEIDGDFRYYIFKTGEHCEKIKFILEDEKPSEGKVAFDVFSVSKPIPPEFKSALIDCTIQHIKQTYKNTNKDMPLSLPYTLSQIDMLKKYLEQEDMTLGDFLALRSFTQERLGAVNMLEDYIPRLLLYYQIKNQNIEIDLDKLPLAKRGDRG